MPQLYVHISVAYWLNEFFRHTREILEKSSVTRLRGKKTKSTSIEYDHKKVEELNRAWELLSQFVWSD